MLRQFQQQKLLQKLSPQQIQLIKLLEVPSVEMTERVMQEVDANPALELGDNAVTEQNDDPLYDTGDGGNNDDFTFDDYAADDDIPDYKMRQSGGESALENWKDWLPVTDDLTLNSFLLDQLNLQELSDDDKKVATFIIGNIDDDGYLRRTPEALSDDLSIILGIEVSVETIKDLIRLIQQFDPPGVGAADLKDCLLLQLRRKAPSPLHDQTITLLEEQFNEVSRKQYEVILKKMNCGEDALKAMMLEITKLNPKPGHLFGSVLEEKREQVVPDFLLENNDGYLLLTLNSGNVPQLHVNKGYLDMASDYKANVKNQTREAREALQFAKEKVDSARWFIEAVRQRQETLMRTMQAIIDYQRAYFLDGDEKLLKPMILKDIAQKTGYDISTISRVSNSKYIQTEFGLFPLRYFFTEGMQTDSGEAVSSLEIKTIIQENIAGEDKKEPLTDDQLSAILTEKGYVIARRTVAKYRDQLGIPVARLRREI
jgi:RNA polymerase sigma-54 factor